MNRMTNQGSGQSVKQPGTAKRDISGFGLVLILMLLCEVAAAQTDNPVFWLLIGPTPMALGFAVIRLLQYRSARKRFRKNDQSGMTKMSLLSEMQEVSSFRGKTA